MNQVLAIGAIVVAGLAGGLAAEKVKLPRISGYIVVGILLGHAALNIIPPEAVESLDPVTEIALGVIAFLIGGSLKVESLRGLGKSVTWITLLQSLGAWFLVTLVLALVVPLIIPGETFWQTYFPMALIIGAISCATAPAATMAVISEYRAKGPMTTTLLAVVALDDAVAVAAFAIARGVSQPLAKPTANTPLSQVLGIPLLGIVEALALGVALGAALVYLNRLVKSHQLLLVAVLGAVMLCAGIAIRLDISLIMANMAIGFVVTNKARREEAFLVVEEIEDILYVMFFVLAGLHFDLSMLKIAGLLALSIVAARYTGKYAGTWIGGTISHAPEAVRRYLGLALLPQAGVAVGLVLLAEKTFPAFGSVMLAAVLTSVIVNELITPPLTKYALFKAGEANK
jgi:Kef-type K+ transport system membrane component KefB